MPEPPDRKPRASVMLETEQLAPKLGVWIRTRLWAQVLIGMVLGVVVGLLLSPSGAALVSGATADSLAAWVALPGKLFLALIQMVVVVLVLSSIVIGCGAEFFPAICELLLFSSQSEFLATFAA